MINCAFFVELPRRIEDLQCLHLVDHEQPYLIVATIDLQKIDYENFIYDMIADRQFLEDHADLCGVGEIWRCILVKQRGQSGGVLVVPDGCYVKFAALAD